MDGLRKVYKHCCICGIRFEDTDGETKTCGKLQCIKDLDKLEEQEEELEHE